MIEIIHLKDERGAGRFGCCTMCAKASYESDKLVRIRFNGTSVVLCEECLDELREAIDISNNEWIPFKTREADSWERESYSCDEMLDCEIPDEGEDILVTYADGTIGYDTFLREYNECYLESGAEFVVDVIAWKPLPAPYQPEGKVE